MKSWRPDRISIVLFRKDPNARTNECGTGILNRKQPVPLGFVLRKDYESVSLLHYFIVSPFRVGRITLALEQLPIPTSRNSTGARDSCIPAAALHSLPTRARRSRRTSPWRATTEAEEDSQGRSSPRS